MSKIFDRDALVYQLAKKGMSVTELANKTGLHRNTIQYLINGQHNKPQKINLFRMAIALDCSPDDLMTETGKE